MQTRIDKSEIRNGCVILQKVISNKACAAPHKPLDHTCHQAQVHKLQKETICVFSHSDKASRVDLSSSRCIKVKINSEKANHVGFAWKDRTW